MGGGGECESTNTQNRMDTEAGQRKISLSSSENFILFRIFQEFERKKITRCTLSLPDFSDENEDSTDSFLQVEDGNSWKFIFLRIVATLYESSSFIKIMNCMM